MYHQNVRGLNSKTHDLKIIVPGGDFDIVCSTDTWLQDGVYYGELFPLKYKVFRCTRDLVTTGVSTGNSLNCNNKCGESCFIGSCNYYPFCLCSSL